MRSILKLLILAALGVTGGFGQMSQPMVGENTTKISDHVWAIMGFPNIAIVVGDIAAGYERLREHPALSYHNALSS